MFSDQSLTCQASRQPQTIEIFLRGASEPCAFSQTVEVNERKFEKAQGVEEVQSSCKPDDILLVDPVPMWDPGCSESDAKHLKDLPALRSLHSFESWTEYEWEDPRARPNRVAHETSSGHIREFMSYIQEDKTQFKSIVRRRRGEGASTWQRIFGLCQRW